MSSLRSENGGVISETGCGTGLVSMTSNRERKILLTVALYFVAVLGINIVSSFLPDSFLWGINHLAFLDPPVRLAVILMVIVLALPAISRRYIGFVEQNFIFQKFSRISVLMAIMAAGIGASLCCYKYRIVTDMYGDTRTLINLLLDQKFSLADVLKPVDREPLTRFVHQSIAGILGIHVKTAYIALSALCGGAFIAFVLFFLHTIRAAGTWKMMALVLLVTAGANQLFFGHVEDYTLIYIGLTLFSLLAWLSFDGKKMVFWMTAMFLIGTRLHLEMILFLPALLYALLYTSSVKYPPLLKYLSWKKVSYIAGLSLLLMLVFYLFYFKAYRYIDGSQQEILEKIFLPVYGYQAPPYNYSLLSLNHFSDFLQEIFLVTSPGVMLVFILAILLISRSEWKEPRIIFFGLAAFYPLLFNFTFNPMLTMPRDWDLLSLVSVPIIFLALALSRKLFEEVITVAHQKMIIGVVISLGLFSISYFYINADGNAASRRLEGIGKWVFKSYHASSSYILNMSAKMIDNLDEQIKRRENVIAELRPSAPVPDYEIGFLYHKLASAQYANRQFEPAAINFQNSLKHDPDNASAIRMLALISLQQWKFKKASEIFFGYNQNVNQPKVTDPQALEFARYCNQLEKLVSSTSDSVTIRRKLEYLFQLTK